jgi:predicted Fe-Mo cluster-binding NifX family protein
MIAMPVEAGKLAGHFGRCRHFEFFTADEASGSILSSQVLPAPAHEAGSIPAWLLEKGVTVVVAGHIGGHAQSLLEAGACRLLAGVPDMPPAELARRALSGLLAGEAEGCCGSCDDHADEGHKDGGCGHSH